MGRLLALVWVVFLVPAAHAVPVDLSNPTPRTVRVEVDQEAHDYALQGGAYGLPIHAAYASSAGIATITVPESAIEAFVDGYFDGVITAVHGSFSDYVIAIDVTTGSVLSASVTGTLNTPAGSTPVSQTASSSALAGYSILNVSGFDLPQFCTSGAGCTLVPGVPYDPVTGRATAVGVDTTAFLDVFAAFGDIRLSEVPPVECDTAINGATFIDGESATVGFTMRSNEASARVVEVKVWIERSDGLDVPAINRGADGTQPLQAGQVAAFPPGVLFVTNPSLPRGAWAIGCRVMDPVTGESLANDRDTFQLLATRP